jgi:hypothetical protein
MKATREILENTVIFEYWFDHKSTSSLVLEDYITRNISVALMYEFCIPVKDEETNDDCEEDLVYDYSDHLCVLHFIKKRVKINEVNCSVLCKCKEGKYYLQLLTTKRIASNEEILIHDINKVNTRTKNYSFKYLIN